MYICIFAFSTVDWLYIYSVKVDKILVQILNFLSLKLYHKFQQHLSYLSIYIYLIMADSKMKQQEEEESKLRKLKLISYHYTINAMLAFINVQYTNYNITRFNKWKCTKDEFIYVYMEFMYWCC